VVPLTIFGSEELDVTEIDFNSLVLVLDAAPDTFIGPPVVVEVPADLGEPADVGRSWCIWQDPPGDEVGSPDGYPDVNVAFSAADVSALIDCSSLNKGDDSPELRLSGVLLDGRGLESLNTQILNIKR
jgi:hypothetical protein